MKAELLIREFHDLQTDAHVTMDLIGNLNMISVVISKGSRKLKSDMVICVFFLGSRIFRVDLASRPGFIIN